MASVLNEGDVHILDMGKPVKLIDIIHRLIEILGGHSEIVIVGLRAGEKVHEELTSLDEKAWTTVHQGIQALNLVMTTKSSKYVLSEVETDSEALTEIDRFLSWTRIVS